VKVAAIQFNPKIGDCIANTKRVLGFIEQAKKNGAKLILLPELALVGYPPRDLLDDEALAKTNLKCLNDVTKASQGTTIVCGFVKPNSDSTGRRYFNDAAILQDGQHVSTYAKRLLPSYDIFDDDRYFEPGSDPCLINVQSNKVAVTICEDVWNLPSYISRSYAVQPLDDIRDQKVDLLINIAASPFSLGKPEKRLNLFKEITSYIEAPALFCNQTGGNDELVFSGCSFVLDKSGKLKARAEAFIEQILYFDTDEFGNENHVDTWANSETQFLYGALQLGLKDYVTKCGASKVCLGLSGGIDSAVTAAVAVAALGKDAVMGICLPTRYTSKESLEDAEATAKNLGIEYRVLGMETLLDLYENLWGEWFHSSPRGLTRENIQPRIRMTLLMAIANENDMLVLNTSNKSELSAGYATLYGDTAGALAVLGDILKTQVYDLARLINSKKEIIAQRSLSREPTAELAEGQKDQDTLPPYEKLDPLVSEIVEQTSSRQQLITNGFSEKLVGRFEQLHYPTEYKRFQLAPVIRVSRRAYGIGRRIPIASNRRF